MLVSTLTPPLTAAMLLPLPAQHGARCARQGQRTVQCGAALHCAACQPRQTSHPARGEGGHTRWPLNPRPHSCCVGDPPTHPPTEVARDDVELAGGLVQHLRCLRHEVLVAGAVEAVPACMPRAMPHKNTHAVDDAAQRALLGVCSGCASFGVPRGRLVQGHCARDRQPAFLLQEEYSDTTTHRRMRCCSYRS